MTIGLSRYGKKLRSATPKSDLPNLYDSETYPSLHKDTKIPTINYYNLILIYTPVRSTKIKLVESTPSLWSIRLFADSG